MRRIRRGVFRLWRRASEGARLYGPHGGPGAKHKPISPTLYGVRGIQVRCREQCDFVS